MIKSIFEHFRQKRVISPSQGNRRRGLPGVSGRPRAGSRHEHNLRGDEGRGGEEGQEKVTEYNQPHPETAVM